MKSNHIVPPNRFPPQKPKCSTADRNTLENRFAHLISGTISIIAFLGGLIASIVIVASGMDTSALGTFAIAVGITIASSVSLKYVIKSRLGDEELNSDEQKPTLDGLPRIH